MRLLSLSIALALVACKPHPTSFAAKGQPFGLVTGVDLGMTVDDVKRFAPEMHPESDSKPPNDVYQGHREPGENYHVSFYQGRVRHIWIDLVKRPLADVTTAWGPLAGSNVA
jgi:hypothetical protein